MVDFEEFCEEYKDDLPSYNNLKSELEVWQYHWNRLKENGSHVPDTIGDTLPLIDSVLFPNVAAAMIVLAVIPVTTCECERSVSTLRRLKSYLRSTMGQDRLNGLALMHVHYAMPLDVSVIVDDFARLHPRRMELVNILKD